MRQNAAKTLKAGCWLRSRNIMNLNNIMCAGNAYAQTRSRNVECVNIYLVAMEGRGKIKMTLPATLRKSAFAVASLQHHSKYI